MWLLNAPDAAEGCRGRKGADDGKREEVRQDDPGIDRLYGARGGPMFGVAAHVGAEPCAGVTWVSGAGEIGGAMGRLRQ